MDEINVFVDPPPPEIIVILEPQAPEINVILESPPDIEVVLSEVGLVGPAGQAGDPGAPGSPGAPGWSSEDDGPSLVFLYQNAKV